MRKSLTSQAEAMLKSPLGPKILINSFNPIGDNGSIKLRNIHPKNGNTFLLVSMAVNFYPR